MRQLIREIYIHNDMTDLTEAVLIYIAYSIIMAGLIFYLGESFKYRFIFGYIFSAVSVVGIVLIFNCSLKLTVLLSIFISSAAMARIPSK